MTNSGWKREEPDSPCQQICLIHPDAGICIGCHRSAKEIRMWSSFSPEQRRKILAALPGRGVQIRRRRGGRRRRSRR